MSEKISFWEAIQSGQASPAIAGLLGGVVLVATNKELSVRDSVAAIFTGGILAFYMAPVIGGWVSADDAMLSLLGLIIGISGMRIGPILAEAGARLTNAVVKRLGVKIDAPPDEDK